ncbi:MAG: multicopper oxidase domain-containing protein [Ktedonobacterales bacterium]
MSTPTNARPEAHASSGGAAGTATDDLPVGAETDFIQTACIISAEKKRNIWLRPKPSDRAALSMLLALVVVSFLCLSLIVALMGNARVVTQTSAATGGSASNAATVNVARGSVPAHQTYNAQPPVAAQGDTVSVRLVAKQAVISIAPDVAYHAWTFNGTVPGPIIRVRQGQTINFTLTNEDQMPHSIDFHAAQTPWNLNYQPVAPGKSFSFSFKANYPGAFLYHCGTSPAMFHIANGMYGAIIVDPAAGWSPAREFVLVQSEFYTRQAADGTYSLDATKMMRITPDYVVFNGYASQYQNAPLQARANQKIRIFIVNAGPSQFSAFPVIGAIFSDVYVDGNPANHTVGDQTITVPPGGGSVVELTLPDPGQYPVVTHSFAGASMGALGIINVTP